MLQEPLRLIYSYSERFQVDESLIDNIFFVEQNIENVKKVTKAIIHSMKENLSLLPVNLFKICNEIKTISETKFENIGNTAIGSFFILRFFSRAIVSPQYFDILIGLQNLFWLKK